MLWALVAAVLLGALAPAMSQALARHGAARGEPDGFYVCSELGARWIHADAVSPGHDAPGHDAAHVFEHCPYCSMHAASLGLPPVGVVVPMRIATTTVVHERHHAVAPAREVWSDAQSRGPPVNA